MLNQSLFTVTVVVKMLLIVGLGAHLHIEVPFLGTMAAKTRSVWALLSQKEMATYREYIC